MADNKAVARRFIEGIDSHNLGVLDEVVAENAVWRVPISPDPVQGREGVRGLVQGFLTAFPDLSIKINDQIAEGDTVVTLITISGTNDGEILGQPATGNKVAWDVVHVQKIVDGIIQSDDVTFDQMSLLTQLGLVPAPAP